jgi:hypothetical protein
MQSNLNIFTAFNNRYYKSPTGNQSSAWLFQQVRIIASDHASASRAGYSSALITETTFRASCGYIHRESDTISMVSYSHMLERAKLAVGLAYKLAFSTVL